MGAEFRSAADSIEDTCANPNAEDFAGFLASLIFFAKLQDVEVAALEYQKKVQNYTETVCGWEKSQHIPDLKDVSGDSIADIQIMLKITQDIQENSKDWKCKYRIYCNPSSIYSWFLKPFSVLP